MGAKHCRTVLAYECLACTCLHRTREAARACCTCATCHRKVTGIGCTCDWRVIEMRAAIRMSSDAINIHKKHLASAKNKLARILRTRRNSRQ